MSFDTGSIPRLRDLAHRLVAPGGKADHVSASETHEISEGLLELLGDVETGVLARKQPRRKGPETVDIDKLPDPAGRQEWIDNLRVGDWIYYDFEVMQIVDESSFSNGSVRFGAFRRHLECPMHPMNMMVKRISDCFRFFNDAVRKISDAPGVNWPDIHRLWVRQWHRTCLGQIPVNEYTHWPHTFSENFEKITQKVGELKIDDVQIFRNKK